MKRFGVLIAALCVLVSCSVDKVLTDANQSLSRGEYFAAIEKYKVFTQKGKDPKKKTEAALKMGEAFYAQGAYAQAVPWLKNGLRLHPDSIELKALYADALRASQKIDEAEKVYTEIAKKLPENQQALNGLESIRLIKRWEKMPPIYLIDNQRTLNSSGNETASAAFPKRKKLLFSSSSENVKSGTINPINGQKLADFFVASYDTLHKRWGIAELPGDSLPINSPGDEAGICVSKSAQMIVFSRANYLKGQKLAYQLYVLKRENGKWEAPRSIPFSADGNSYQYPALSADASELYFASDRPGGQGKTDIWKSAIKDGDFGEPVNLGPQINTPGRETSPFLKKNGHLYFSSDYHPGVGGLDIFHATPDLNSKWTVENMSTPVNSPDDDFCALFYTNDESGLLSSRRKGSRGYDLYSFYSPPSLFQCFGKVHNTETDSIVANANVRIVGTDGTSIITKTENGIFSASLKPETDYAIMVYRQGFLNAQAKISTKGMRESFEFNLDLKQTPTDVPIRIDNINYETGKWDLLPESRKSLDQLVETLNINPNISVEIMSHTDDIGQDAANNELSQKRAEAVVQYLVGKGIPAPRLSPKGYGETRPLHIRRKTAEAYPFLHEGDELTPAFIEKLPTDKQETARALNRRTEFQVLDKQTGK